MSGGRTAGGRPDVPVEAGRAQDSGAPVEGGRIVVIHADRDIRSTTFGVLSAAGHRVRSASSVDLGLAIVRSWQPDLVLVGSTLPHLDAVELAGVLAEDPSTGGILVLLIVSPSPGVNSSQPPAPGFAGSLVRPLTSDGLLDAVDGVLAARRSGAPSAFPRSATGDRGADERTGAVLEVRSPDVQ